MNFGPKRAHILSIFENFFKDFSLLILAIIIAVVKHDINFIVDNIAVLIIVLLGPAIRLFGYLFTTYEIDDTRIIKKSAFISKKVLEVPISTVTTVDVSQNLMQQLFHIYQLNIDNASNISNTESKINVTLGKKDMEQVRGLLIAGREGMDGLNLFSSENEQQGSEDNSKTVISPKQFMLYGLLESKGVLFLQLIGGAFALLTYLNISDSVLDRIADGMEAIAAANLLILFIFAAILIIGLAIAVAAPVVTFIKYYDFSIYDNGKALKIQYGLINKKTYTIQKNRITGFLYQQSALMRCFGIGSLKVHAIGYGGAESDEHYEDPLIYPLVKRGKLSKVIEEITPGMEIKDDYSKPKKGSLHYFFYSITFVISAIAMIVSIIVSMKIKAVFFMWILGVAAFAFALAGVFLEHSNSGIYSCDSTVSVTYGGFTKNSVFIKVSSLETASFSSSYFKNKKGIGHISLGFIAPLIYANPLAKNLCIEDYEELKKILIY